MSENSISKEKIDSIPRSPGVYIMKDAQEKVIYIGKANNLKNRVGSYFTGKDTRPMAPFLLARLNDIEFITTATEKEALILENNLIKKHRPRYNVILRDDKTYYHLSIDPAEKFPRLQLARKKVNKAALYFGPYPSGLAAKETLRFVQQVFPLRSCRNREFQLRARPCLEYQIGRCLAPCKGLIDEEAYGNMTQGAVSFLQGRKIELLADLKKQMGEAAETLNYEEAARLRDRIGFLEHALEKQHVDGAGEHNQDVLGIDTENNVHLLCILFIRDGKLLGSKSFAPVKTKEDAVDVISAALRQYYDDADLPEEVILPFDLPDAEIIGEYLSERKQKKVMLTVPVRGAKKALSALACRNARELLLSASRKEEQTEALLAVLQNKLDLKRVPRRIECYDISNIGGKSAVGSQVVFQDGEPDKPSYRRYRIRSADEPDDYGMMREMLTRRFRQDDTRPDLVVVDGGKGQLNIALSVFRELKITVDVIGLAKEERTFGAAGMINTIRTGKAQDRVYLPRRKDAVFLSSAPRALAILQRIRDEAHRFAISYHRKLKEKSDFNSLLDEIPDIGGKRKRLLLKHFGSVQQVQKASLADLQNISGIGKELAKKIYSHWKKE